MKSKKLIIVQHIIPEYRLRFFESLRNSLRDQFVLWSGNESFDLTVKHNETITVDKSLQQYFFLGRRIMIQLLDWQAYLTKNVLVLELNPRILSTWPLLIIRRLFLRKTVLWGHAWSRAGRKSKTELIRHLMRCLANEIITYTEQQKTELNLKMPRKTIRASSNALLYKKEIKSVINDDMPKNIIYVGRLITDKKVTSLVTSFERILSLLPQKSNLIIVGSGPESLNIKKFIEANELSSRVLLFDAIFDNERLANLYAGSLVSVSPGYVGLNIIQSFSYGVPMVLSKNEPHSPEIEASKDGSNVVYFESERENALDQALLKVFENKKFWIAQRFEIHRFCKSHYSIERMCEPFLEAVQGP